CCLLLSETAALSLPWTGIEPGLPSLPVLRSEPRSGNDRVRDQGGFCNIVGGVVTPPTMLRRTLLGASLKRGWTDPIHDADLLLVDLDFLHQSPNDLPSRVPVRLL